MSSPPPPRLFINNYTPQVDNPMGESCGLLDSGGEPLADVSIDTTFQRGFLYENGLFSYV